VAVISHGLWQRRFGGAQDIIGRKIIVNDSPFEIIGAMPAGFYFLPGKEVDIWMPAAFSAQDLSNFDNHYLQCVGRLRPGINFRQASDSMVALGKRTAEKRATMGAPPCWFHCARNWLGRRRRRLWFCSVRLRRFC